MLVLTRKKYEIEEPIRLEDENGNVLYELTMQITDDEMLKIKKILFSDAERRKKEYLKASIEQKKKMEENLDTEIKEKSEDFERICFKEHREKLKDLAGEYKYDVLVESEMYFFINFFV